MEAQHIEVLRNCAGETDNTYCSADCELDMQKQSYLADQIQLVFNLNFSGGK